MNEQERLAKAMNVCHTYRPRRKVQGNYNIITQAICEFCEQGPHRDFKPFADANDDYAVLMHMRSLLVEGDEIWDFFCEELHEQGPMDCYVVGDFARAALKVLDDGN